MIEDFKITAEEEDYLKIAEENAGRYNIPADKLIEAYKENEDVKMKILNDKVLDMIISKAKVEEVEEIVKKECYVFDFAPNRALRQIADYACRLNVNETNPEKNVEELLMETGLAASTLSVVLLGLEMKKIIRQLPGRRYIRSSDP